MQAYELVELIGTNWGLDTKWQGGMVSQHISPLLGHLQESMILKLCSKIPFSIILQDNTSKKVPPFAEIKEFIIKKAGESLLRTPNASDEGCDKCTPRDKKDKGGTRRIYASISISGAPPKRFEWVARCTCARGAQNLKAYNI